MAKSPQQKGRDYEAEIADRFGGEVVEGSGNQPFAKLDVSGQKILLSCKHTVHESYRLTAEVVDEAIRAIDAPGGLGGDTIPGVAVGIEGEQDLIVLRLSDFLRIVMDDVKLATPSKGEARQQRARKPALFRDDQ